MNPRDPPPPGDSTDEISALVATLQQTEQRLEELTGGQVDTVTDRDGRMFVLQHAQEQLRQSEMAKQAAILNALPAHIAMLDRDGFIISVNEAWNRFGSSNSIQGAQHGIDVNYIDVCDNARGEGSSEAHQVADGIRSVLVGAAKSFSIEYACHSPAEQRWFLLTVTPLADGRRSGAVVMHLDITQRKAAEDVLTKRAAELERFNRLSVGRELQMIELKKQINAHAKQAGQEPPYKLAFLSPEAATTNLAHEPTP